MKKILLTLSTIGVFLMPYAAFAQQGNSDLQSNLLIIFNLLNFIIPILVILAVVWFIVSVLVYVFQSDEEKKKTARQNMIWGIIGIFVIVAVWGLVNVIQNTLDLDTDAVQGPGVEDNTQCPPGTTWDTQLGQCI